MSASIQEEVLQLFERHRVTPSAAFDESHFLDFLLVNPKGNRAIYNSFLGLRRYNAFIEEIQLHFSICFSLKDFEAGYSLSKFVHRVEELQLSRRSSLASLRNQNRAGFGGGPIFLCNIFLLFLIMLASKKNVHLLAICLLFLCILLNGVAVLSFIRWRVYQKRLMNQLQAKDKHEA